MKKLSMLTASLALALVVISAFWTWHLGTFKTEGKPGVGESSTAAPPESTPTRNQQTRSAKELLAPRVQSKDHKESATKRNGREHDAPSIVSRPPAGYVIGPFVANSPEVLTNEGMAIAADRITGAIPAKSSERFRALTLLHGCDLPEDVKTSLLEYLADPDRHQGMSDSAMYVFVNELVAVFHDNPRLDGRYLDVSRSVVDDERQKEVVRSYVLQGLSRAWPNATPAQASEILEVFRASLDRPGTSLPATALLALDRVRREGGVPAADADSIKTELSAHLLDHLAAAETGERTRITATGIVGKLGLKEAFPHLLEIMEDPEAKHTVPEKIAVLSALKSLRYPETEELLREGMRSDHPLVARSAAKILQSIKVIPE